MLEILNVNPGELLRGESIETTSIPTADGGMNLEPLFEYDKSGKPRFWVIEVLDDSYRAHSGILGGAVLTGDWTTCEAKNVGRSNETTPAEQAVAEAEALWTKKTDLGYATNIEESGVKYTKPMLASEYDEDDPKLSFPVMVQPKLDGMRCIARRDGLWSRKGKRIVSCPHIEADLAPIFEEYPDMVLDGELYNHEFRDNFNKIMSLARKTKPTEADIEECAQKMQYHVYDLAVPDLHFFERAKWTTVLLGKLPRGFEINQVATLICISQEEVDAHFHRWIDSKNGYEGLMVRDPQSVYAFDKRPKGLQKRKPFVTEEFEIAYVEEGKGKAAGHVKRVFFTCPETGDACKAGTRGDDDFTADLWDRRDELPGQIVTVRYQNRTPAGAYRMAVVIDYHGEERTD